MDIDQGVLLPQYIHYVLRMYHIEAIFQYGVLNHTMWCRSTSVKYVSCICLYIPRTFTYVDSTTPWEELGPMDHIEYQVCNRDCIEYIIWGRLDLDPSTYYQIHTKQYLKNNTTNTHTKYVLHIYVKLNNWESAPAYNIIKEKMVDFEKTPQNSHLCQ